LYDGNVCVDDTIIGLKSGYISLVGGADSCMEHLPCGRCSDGFVMVRQTSCSKANKPSESFGVFPYTVDVLIQIATKFKRGGFEWKLTVLYTLIRVGTKLF